ncbi:MAG TPA: ATPase [Alphaproteobacteria bacterium]|nr:ATPase [Alphaproteobacteria bacterium]
MSLALMLWATAAKADVAQPSAGLTVISFQLHVKGSAASAYTAATHPEKWWNGEHSYSGSAANMTLDPVAGGCWCEKLPAGGSVQHMRVLAAVPGSLLRLSGGLGPLQAQPLTGVMNWAFKDDPAGGSTIDFKYRLSGATDLPATWPQAVDGVLNEQLQRLQHLLNDGAP